MACHATEKTDKHLDLRRPTARPLRARLGNSWSDRKWRRAVFGSLSKFARPAPFGHKQKASPDVDPRMSWSPKTPAGAIWPQPMRGFS
jgi:hypothetical protein